MKKLHFSHRKQKRTKSITVIDINTGYGSAHPLWRKAAALHDHNASSNIMSRGLATKEFGLSIRADTDNDAIIRVKALGKRLKLRGWVEVEWSKEGETQHHISRFLLTRSEDPPFDVVLGPKPDLKEPNDQGSFQSDDMDKRSKKLYRSLFRCF